jgi:hypothetical protein
VRASLPSIMLALGAAACGSSDGSSRMPGDAAVEGAVFVAFGADFKGFRKWQSFDVTLSDDAGAPHPEATLTEYINDLPPHGASEFPLRTIIVKQGNDPEATNFFAMVKRGGDYNKNGPIGWEWSELTDLDPAANSVRIVWRGVGPPAGEMYGGDPNGGCNQCHTPDRNDAVLAPALALENF